MCTVSSGERQSSLSDLAGESLHPFFPRRQDGLDCEAEGRNPRGRKAATRQASLRLCRGGKGETPRDDLQAWLGPWDWSIWSGVWSHSCSAASPPGTAVARGSVISPARSHPPTSRSSLSLGSDLGPGLRYKSYLYSRTYVQDQLLDSK